MAESCLLVRLHSLGDVVLASGTARALAEKCNTSFATCPEYAPVVERIPGDIKVIPVSGWRDLRKAASGYSSVTDLQNNLTTRLALLGLMPSRYSFSRKKRKRIISGSGEFMEWRASEYFRVSGASGNHRPVLERRQLPDPGRKAVGIVVGGRWAQKSIPDGVAAELSRLFCDVLNAEVFLLGSESQRFASAAIAEECGYRKVTSVAGEGGIDSLISRIEGLDLLVTPDSGPAHIGIALGVPTQVLFTSTSPALGFYEKNFAGGFEVPQTNCRPCHKHGGVSCSAGDERCRKMIVPRRMFQEALCLMQ